MKWLRIPFQQILHYRVQNDIIVEVIIFCSVSFLPVKIIKLKFYKI
jgi:hypothetical protein